MPDTRRTVSVRSPLRVDFVGMTDYLPACKRFGGSIVNATINKYIYATAELRDDERIVFNAPDQGDLRVEVPSAGELDPEGELGLAQEIVSRFDLGGRQRPRGVELTTYSQMPGGAGLGSSSTIATCIIAALNALTGCGLTNHQMARMAIDCETAALHTTYGWQDQYSPVTGGGVKYMRYWPEETGHGVEIDPLPLTQAQLASLQRALVVCYSGISRPAGSILDAVAQGVETAHKEVIASLKGMSECADQMRLHLLEGQLEQVGALLSEVWRLHKQLHPDVSNARVEELYRVAMSAGAIGGRVCGAGGGGTLMFYCPPPADYGVARALEDADAQVFDVAIDTQGLVLW
jgi:D-glycero-alpha-D-manno-heptose-7-phosphate kinase